MHGIGIITLSIPLLAGCAFSQDYFPLQTGNVWIYKRSGTRAGAPLTVEVTGVMVANGMTYSVVTGLTSTPAYLRKDDSGTVFYYDMATGQEQPWWSFQATPGTPYDSTVSCCGKAQVVSRSAKYSGLVGAFDYALEMSYPGVFQVGIARDLFLPYIGLVSRSIATGGPSYGGYDLIYARIGGVTVVSAPEISFALTLDQAVYTSRDMIARLTLRATQPDPLTLTFNSGQIFDLVIRDSGGAEVFRWSKGRLFTQVMQTIAFSGEKDWAIQIALTDPDGKPLPAGKYVAEAYLTNSGPRAYSASAGFEIK
jgi:hypothetical protein